MFSREFIQKVIDATDIVQEISKQTALVKKGPRHLGKCPFHSEKTASFSVTPDKQLYYCFGCGVGGNVISFVMEFYKYTFSESVEYLAGLANIPLEYENAQSRGKSEDKYKNKKMLHQINMEAARFYYAMLQKNEDAKNYILRRGLSKETIQTFMIGYAPNTRAGLFTYLKSKGYSDEEILLSTLCRKNENGFYDYFRNRVMFPIQDVTDNVVAFGGRVMDNSQPKYLNSPETMVFLKHNTLFNLNRAKNNVKQAPLVMVEGYMDVISLYEKNIKNSCATLGTALSEDHARLIKRYSDNIVLCYDGDNAGQNAILRGIDVLRSQGVEPRVFALPKEDDPDTFVIKHGKEVFDEKMKNAVYSMDYKIDILKAKYSLDDIVQRSHFIKDSIEEISKIKDMVQVDYYIKTVARTANTELEIVRNELHKKNKGKTEVERFVKETTSVEKTKYKMELELLSYVTKNYANYEFFTDCGGGLAIFEDEEIRNVYNIVENLYESDKTLDILDNLIYNNKIAHIVSKIASMGYNTDNNTIKNYVFSLILRVYSDELLNVKKEIEIAQSEKDNDKCVKLLKRYSILKEKLLEIKSGGGLN